MHALTILRSLKPSLNTRTTFVNTVSLLLILLFVYAAASKLLDMEKFDVQTRQSPLLSSYTRLVIWLVPLTELVIVALLSAPSTRRIGLLLSCVLMNLFSGYISILLAFSPNVPCSCGGILEKMSWQQHLYFNLVFAGLALMALWVYSAKQQLAAE